MMKPTIKSSILSVSSALALTLALGTAPLAAAQDGSESPAMGASEMATNTAWGVQSVDVSADPSIVYGVLPNGMKYAIQKNQTPKNAASLRLHIAAGYISETAPEAGISHFIEHMAFNGTKNVPEGEMVRILERQGLAFGADSNATTSLDFTSFELDLPRTDAESIDTGLFLLREVAGNISFNPEAVDRERGILLSEVQTRNTPDRRRAFDLLGAVLPDTPLSKPGLGGTAETYTSISPEMLKSYYYRFYRPEYATLVAVGDFDVAQMEAEIKAKFGDWKGTGPAGRMTRGTVNVDQPMVFDSFTDPAIQPFVSIDFAKPIDKKPDSIAKRGDQYVTQLASAIMAQRFEKIARQPGAQILGGGISISSLIEVADLASLITIGTQNNWQGALATGEQELRRALQFGVTQSELEEQLANIDTTVRNAAAQAATRKSDALAQQLMGSIYGGDVTASPQTELEIFDAVKPSLTVEAVNAKLRSAFGTAPSSLHISSKTDITDVKTAATQVLAESAKVAVTAPEEAKAVAFAYSDFGPSGKITENKTIADLGIRTIRFANNVKLNLKKTDFEAGKLRYSVRFGGGQLALPEPKPGLDLFFQLSAGLAGLGKHDIGEIQRLSAGKAVQFGLNLNEDSFNSTGATTATDLELQMQLLAAMLTDPGYRAEADTLYQSQMTQVIPAVEAQPPVLAQIIPPYYLTGEDPRFGIADLRDATKVGLSDMKAALDTAKDAPIEITLVGDFDEQSAINIVARTFGALPKRSAAKPDYSKRRKMSFTADSAVKTLYHQGEADQGMVVAYWPTTDDSDHAAEIVRDMLNEVFKSALRDEIREKLGATYSPQTTNLASSTYTGYGHISSTIVVDPAKIADVEAAISRVTAELRAGAPSDDALTRARAPLLEKIEQSGRDNGAWLAIAEEAQSRPERLDRWRREKALYESVTPAQIQAAAQKYLTDANRRSYRMIVDPAKVAAEPAAGAEVEAAK
ncbi:M16 family metallopeptidase [Sphingorhabdus arenilitoris]|uniref:M16 family metallopeptidase n=1 Tax=Sphingorhabdus arenilitoris TaxID=1490041 RepID=A0ABV8RHH9_9SPHN